MIGRAPDWRGVRERAVPYTRGFVSQVPVGTAICLSCSWMSNQPTFRRDATAHSHEKGHPTVAGVGDE